MTLRLDVAPTTEPVTLAEAKVQLRVDGTDDDDRITALIAAVREYVEVATGRALVTQTWTLVVDGFPGGGFEIPKPPLKSLTQITYVDVDGVTQTLSTDVYVVTQPTGPRAASGRVDLAYAQAWPATKAEVGAVSVTFDAGYGAADAVPDGLKQAMLLLIREWFDGTDNSGVSKAVESLMMGFRILKAY